MTEKATNYSRRTVVRTVGTMAATVGLAGCIGGTGTNGGGTKDPDESYVEDEPDYGGWFEGANNYNGTVDRREQDEVTVQVGAGSRGMAFAPASVMVSSGTTIVWEWTGRGSSHNVAARGGTFKSEFTGSEGHTFEYTLENSGIYKYVCEPHESSGMKGAVVVDESE
ncbi:halocyanin domain-containing protein [Haladaptatus litoreus]|uniref:Halocyanin domain-containing protein n=1 Tax=Haladaptatus litoreus TaxID=553468 RepID=A0A1N6VWU3_9EURY|nr:halocyanin domain-containing protein [Haladaptatus litoreus]SIQ82339.1 halocyanin domain-containing protein [Haladaptatus litoreus]